MSTLKQFGLGFLFSIVIITVFKMMQGIDFAQYIEGIIWGIYAVTFLLWIAGIVIRTKIISLNNLQVAGEQEDEVDAHKYRKFSDMSLSLQISSTLAIVGMSMSLMLASAIYLVFVGVVMTFASYILVIWIMNIVQKMYPERNLPKITKENYAEQLLAKSDEGEKHIMLQGLYKSYHLVNILLVLGMIATAIYSMVTEESQLFAIILMGIILIAVNSRYMLAVRNK